MDGRVGCTHLIRSESNPILSFRSWPTCRQAYLQTHFKFKSVPFPSSRFSSSHFTSPFHSPTRIDRLHQPPRGE